MEEPAPRDVIKKEVSQRRQSYAIVFADPAIPFNWDLTNLPAAGVGSAVAGAISRAAKEQFADIAEFFPFRHGINAKVFLANDYMLASLHSITGTRLCSEFSLPEIQELSQAAAGWPITHEDLVEVLTAKWFSADRFTYVGPYRNSRGCWPHLVQHLESWVRNSVVPKLLNLNQRRVERAIPPPPVFDTTQILGALWVLESETGRQGTAFRLEGVGMVTCAHALAEDSSAFRADDKSYTKFPIQVRKRNDTIDLAVFTLDCDVGSALQKGEADKLKVMDHLMVAGFPNYRFGDSGYVTPGIVTGFRTVSSIRRILTNAPIIAGNSGGPVVSSGSRVIGVAVTGADDMPSAPKTENHGIIPIDALALL